MDNVVVTQLVALKYEILFSKIVMYLNCQYDEFIKQRVHLLHLMPSELNIEAPVLHHRE